MRHAVVPQECPNILKYKIRFCIKHHQNLNLANYRFSISKISGFKLCWHKLKIDEKTKLPCLKHLNQFVFFLLNGFLKISS